MGMGPPWRPPRVEVQVQGGGRGAPVGAPLILKLWLLYPLECLGVNVWSCFCKRC